jgi:hypothetical protein
MLLFLTKAILPVWLKKIINILCYRGYSFYLKNYAFNRKIATSESAVIISGTIVNNSIHSSATAYIALRIIDPYKPGIDVFNSDADLPFNKKRNLIIYDIAKGASGQFAYTWSIPKGFAKPVLYLRIDIWSPRMLYNKKRGFYYPYRFDTSGWKGFIEIIDNRSNMKKLKIFISYTWMGEEHSHRRWVLGLADTLIKHGLEVFIDRDLHGGQEITKFMEKKIEEADIVLLVCSDIYTQKANDRIEGTGYETVIATRKYYSTNDKEKFIPITRDNNLPADQKLPTYLGKTLFIDMDVPTWQGEPMQKLLQAINRHK